MKKTYKIVLVFFLLLNLVAFAQITGPSDNNNNGNSNLEGNDPITISGPADENNNGGTSLEGADPAASINSELWILILLGIVYSFFLIERNRQIKIK
jgi:hypothetical protein